MRREIEVRPVLDAQHRRLPPHALQRALPVRRQHVLRRHRRVRRLVDEPVVAPHLCMVALGRPRERFRRSLRLRVRDAHQPPPQACVAQGCVAQQSAARPSPSPSTGRGCGAGTPSRERHSRASGYSQTAFTGTCSPAAAKRPRPAVWPTRRQLEAASEVPAWRSCSTKVFTSRGR